MFSSWERRRVLREGEERITEREEEVWQSREGDQPRGPEEQEQEQPRPAAGEEQQRESEEEVSAPWHLQHQVRGGHQQQEHAVSTSTQ